METKYYYTIRMPELSKIENIIGFLKNRGCDKIISIYNLGRDPRILEFRTDEQLSDEIKTYLMNVLPYKISIEEEKHTSNIDEVRT